MLLMLNDNCFSNVSCETVSIIDFARTPYPNKALSVPGWESVPGAQKWWETNLAKTWHKSWVW